MPETCPLEANISNFFAVAFGTPWVTQIVPHTSQTQVPWNVSWVSFIKHTAPAALAPRVGQHVGVNVTACSTMNIEPQPSWTICLFVLNDLVKAGRGLRSSQSDGKKNMTEFSMGPNLCWWMMAYDKNMPASSRTNFLDLQYCRTPAYLVMVSERNLRMCRKPKAQHCEGFSPT